MQVSVGKWPRPVPRGEEETVLRMAVRLAVIFVGAHLVLGAVLLCVEAAHGINDQDASFAMALLFHWLNAPTVWLLVALGVAPRIGLVVLVGAVQWALVACVVAAMVLAIIPCCARVRRIWS